MQVNKAQYMVMALLCIIFSGCAVHPTVRDQERSLQGIIGDIRFPGPASEYLLDRSALVFAGKDVSLVATYRYDEKDGDVYNFEGNADSLSMATALSTDGYFLTTAHSVDSNEVVVCYMSKGEIQRGPARILLELPEIDVALIKADIDCKFCFDLTNSDIPIGHKVLTYGGPQGVVAGGSVQKIKKGTLERESIEIPYEKIKTSLAIGRGGSGSPIIDLDGQLHGICTDGWHGLLPKLIGGYVTNGMKPSFSYLRSIIEQDRKFSASMMADAKLVD
jgi:hypothetical protein